VGVKTSIWAVAKLEFEIAAPVATGRTSTLVRAKANSSSRQLSLRGTAHLKRRLGRAFVGILSPAASSALLTQPVDDEKVKK
jgi:hypothetical protein